MAKFYGTTQGQRGQATRLGHRSIESVAASWDGAVKTVLSEHNGETWARITKEQWGSGGEFKLIWDGPLRHLHGPGGQAAR